LCGYNYRFRELEVGDRIFYDLNADGRQASDGSEPGIAGVLLELRASDGRVVATTLSAADGTYNFNAGQALSVQPGESMSVVVVTSDNTLPLDTLVLSLPDAGADDIGDSDAIEIVDGSSVALTLSAWGTFDTDVADFCFQSFLEIGDYGLCVNCCCCCCCCCFVVSYVLNSLV
jgi:hypothetical protein